MTGKSGGQENTGACHGGNQSDWKQQAGTGRPERPHSWQLQKQKPTLRMSLGWPHRVSGNPFSRTGKESRDWPRLHSSLEPDCRILCSSWKTTLNLINTSCLPENSAENSLISLVEVTEVVKLVLYHMVPGVNMIHPKIAECFVHCWVTLVDTPWFVVSVVSMLGTLPVRWQTGSQSRCKAFPEKFIRGCRKGGSGQFREGRNGTHPVWFGNL